MEETQSPDGRHVVCLGPRGRLTLTDVDGAPDKPEVLVAAGVDEFEMGPTHVVYTILQKPFNTTMTVAACRIVPGDRNTPRATTITALWDDISPNSARRMFVSRNYLWVFGASRLRLWRLEGGRQAFEAKLPFVIRRPGDCPFEDKEAPVLLAATAHGPDALWAFGGRRFSPTFFQVSHSLSILRPRKPTVAAERFWIGEFDNESMSLVAAFAEGSRYESFISVHHNLVHTCSIEGSRDTFTTRDYVDPNADLSAAGMDFGESLGSDEEIPEGAAGPVYETHHPLPANHRRIQVDLHSPAPYTVRIIDHKLQLPGPPRSIRLEDQFQASGTAAFTDRTTAAWAVVVRGEERAAERHRDGRRRPLSVWRISSTVTGFLPVLRVIRRVRRCGEPLVEFV